MKRIKKLAVILMTLAILAACTNSATTEKEGKKHITFVYNFATNSLDPNVDSSYVPLRAGITETLIRLNEESLTIEPWLAESWEGTNEGENWTIKLKDNITFQNGNEMNGEAVKASLERTIQENVAIKNALKIESIEADGQILRITTTEPFPEFISELVNPNVSIIDVTEEDYVNNPIGTGPFKVTSFVPGSKVELERNETYWGEKAKLETVTFSFNEDANARSLALESGNADIVFRPEVESIESLKANDGIEVESTATFRVHQMTMNMKRESLKDINVRKAVDALINRQEIVDSILLGYAEVANGPFPSSLPFATAFKERETGADAAIDYLEKAGYTLKDGIMQKNGEQLSFTLLTYSARADLPLIAQVFQSDAKQIGINVEIRQIEIPEEYMASNRDWDLATYSNLTAPRGDAGYYLNATYHPNGALNFSGANEPELTEILDELNRTVDQETRALLAEQAANYIDANTMNSFVLYPDTLVAYDANKIKNWVTSKSEYYMITNKLDVE